MLFKQFLSVVILSICFFISINPTVSKAARVDDVNIKRVRAYVGGNAHIDLSKAVSNECGARIRIKQQDGTENVMKLAIAALMSGNKVVIVTEDAKSGNFCNLNFIWLQNR